MASLLSTTLLGAALALSSLAACSTNQDSNTFEDERWDDEDKLRIPNFGLTGAALEAELLDIFETATGRIGDAPGPKFDGVRPLTDFDESLAGTTSGFCKSVDLVADINDISSKELSDNTGIHLATAQRLAFLSALEYASPFYAAQIAEDMGFGDPGDGLKWRKLLAFEAQTFIEAIADRTSARTLEIQQNMVLRRAYSAEKIQFFSVGSTQAMWAEHPSENMAVLIFRGTEPTKLADVLTDLDVRTTEVPGWGRSHRGFLDGWQAKQPNQMPNVNIVRGNGSIIDLTSDVSIQDLVNQKLASVAHRKDFRIWVSGHSLGGALAMVATTAIVDSIENGVVVNGSIVNGQYNTSGVTTRCEDAASGKPCLVMPKYRLGGLYDFGQPRVGLSDMVTSMHAAANGMWAGADGMHGTNDDVAGETGFPYVRFQHQEDIVTLLPGAVYAHGGQCVHLDDSGTGEKTLNNLGTTDLRTDPSIGSVEDHSMDAYYYPLLKQHAESKESATNCND